MVSDRSPDLLDSARGKVTIITLEYATRHVERKQREQQNDQSKFVRLMAASKYQSRNGKFSVFGFESEPTAAGRSRAQTPFFYRPVWNLFCFVLMVNLTSVVDLGFIAMLCSLLSRLKSSVLDLKGILRH